MCFQPTVELDRELENSKTLEIEQYISHRPKQNTSNEYLKDFKIKENKNTAYQNLWKLVKAALRWDFTAFNKRLEETNGMDDQGSDVFQTQQD